MKILCSVSFRKIFFGLTIFIIGAIACNNKQSEQNEAKELRQRFSGFVKAITLMNIDSIQAYTYPKLFTILPRNESRQSMKESYLFFKEKAELDSVLIDTLYPIFHIDKGSYSIAIYSMSIRIPLDTTENITNKTLTDTTGTKHLIDGKYAAPQSTLFATLMRGMWSKYGIEVTGFSEINGIRTMRLKVVTIAAKDEYAKDWTFLTVISDQELINKLFSKKVLEKLSSHN